jgi:hypothetical protein
MPSGFFLLFWNVPVIVPFTIFSYGVLLPLYLLWNCSFLLFLFYCIFYWVIFFPSMLLHEFQFISMNSFYMMDLGYPGTKIVDLIISSFTPTVLKISSLLHILSIYWIEILLFHSEFGPTQWNFYNFWMIVELIIFFITEDILQSQWWWHCYYASMLQNWLCFVGEFFSVFLKNTSVYFCSVSPLICNVIFSLKIFSFYLYNFNVLFSMHS